MPISSGNVFFLSLLRNTNRDMLYRIEPRCFSSELITVQLLAVRTLAVGGEEAHSLSGSWNAINWKR